MRYITDPACPDSWAAEPLLRRLMLEFGESLSFTWVMGGLARDYRDGPAPVDRWLAVSSESRMPLDPLLWRESPIASTYPACMAVKAAQEQGEEAGTRFLRAAREGIMCFRRKLDGTEALVEAAREAGLDVRRFRVDLQSHAIVEAFGEDLEERRSFDGGEPLPLPSAVLVAEDGSRTPHSWPFVYDELRDAAAAAGAKAAGEERTAVLDALRRFGRMATREVEEVCRMPEPRAFAELWRLASEFEVKPTRVLTGWLWESA